MEERFKHDFGQVRIHTDGHFADRTGSLGAAAYTVGSDIAIAPKYRDLAGMAQQRLLAHELAHVVQQQGAGLSQSWSGHAAAERQASNAADAYGYQTPISVARSSVPIGTLQMQPDPPFKAGAVRSPAFEELVTQESQLIAGAQGSSLTTSQTELARTIFGHSIDYSRVRLLPTAKPLWFRTVGNVIRVPSFFTIDSSVAGLLLPVDYMRQTFIHEMTHVWQYQHGGTSYISHALAPQIAAMVQGKSRNTAYCYEAQESKSFWDFTPEQQGMIVENTFLMREKQQALLCGADQDFNLETDPKKIAPLQPIHEKYVAQMQAALPEAESTIMLQRSRDVMSTPGQQFAPADPQRQLLPTKPLLQITF
jgi:predicted SprT family Zn-dependent metalloprotease